MNRSAPILTALVVSAICALTVRADPKIVCDGQEDNLATYQAMHRVLFMERDTSRINEFYADEIINHNNDDGSGEQYSTVKASDMAKFWDASREKDPDRTLDDQLILCVGDFVVVRTTLKSHFVFPMAGIEPTGAPYQYTATDIYRFENRKVVERWGNNDLASAYRQLGFKISAD